MGAAHRRPPARGCAALWDLQRELGIPTNILATRLRELEQAEVLRRIPLKHNTRAYELTPRGLALGEALDALRQWGEGIT